MRTVGSRERSKNGNGDPIDKGGSIGKLCSQDGQCLKGIAEKECLANVFSKATVVNGTDMPQDPSTRQSKTTV